MTVTNDDALVGRTLDQRYVIHERIARGGMASVYRATDLRLDRMVAVFKANFRAMGAPSNLPACAKAFQCKAGSPMVRTGDKQVVIW